MTRASHTAVTRAPTNPLSVSFISFLERGERVPTLPTICRIAKALRVKPVALLQYLPVPEVPADGRKARVLNGGAPLRRHLVQIDRDWVERRDALLGEQDDAAIREARDTATGEEREFLDALVELRRREAHDESCLAVSSPRGRRPS